MKHSFRPLLLSALALVLVLGISTAAAQDTLDSTAEPNFGTASLSTGFQPDPFIVTVTSGGQLDASTLDIGGCRGFITTSPDYRLNWSGTSDQLRIFFVGLGDATLIVQGPNSATTCNDDYNSLDPAVEFSNPDEGIYNIWIGSYSAQEFIPGYLMITELDSVPGAITSDLLGLGGAADVDAQSGTGLDPNANAVYGTVELAPGFQPDPFTAQLLSGGANNVATQNIGAGCVGHAATSPDYSVMMTGEPTLLRFFFIGEGDTTIIVRDPSGAFHCNDDFALGSRDPLVEINQPAAGEYDVWVGSFSANDLVNGTLYVSELSGSDPSTIGQ